MFKVHENGLERIDEWNMIFGNTQLEKLVSTGIIISINQQY